MKVIHHHSMTQLQTNTIDFASVSYRNAYSRINGIAIVGEQEAHDNFMQLAKLIPASERELVRLGKIEAAHKRSFIACGRNLQVTPDLDFAQTFFANLRQIFQTAAAAQQIATCLVVQSLVIECFAIAAYNNYLPVADNFARKITQSVVADEYSHLNFGEIWLRESFDRCRDEIDATTRQVIPIIWQMLNEVAADLEVLGMNKTTVLEEFIAHYGEALNNIGFSLSDIIHSLSVMV